MIICISIPAKVKCFVFLCYQSHAIYLCLPFHSPESFSSLQKILWFLSISNSSVPPSPGALWRGLGGHGFGWEATSEISIWGLCFIGLSHHPLGSPACYFTGFWIVLLFFPARFLDYNLCYFRMMFVSFVFYMWERILPRLSWNVKASCLWCLKSISALIISLVELVHVTWLVLISILRRLLLWQMKSPKHVIRISNWHMIILQSAICNLVLFGSQYDVIIYLFISWSWDLDALFCHFINQ
jgi:hypothetical protein